MRHRVRGRKFGKEKKVRKPFLLSICKGLIEHGSIQTTQARAKEIKSKIEKFVTKSKIDSVNTRRYLRTFFPEKIVKKLIERGLSYRNLNGGYTRIFKTNKRKTDGAQMATIEFVNINNSQISDRNNKK